MRFFRFFTLLFLCLLSIRPSFADENSLQKYAQVRKSPINETFIIRAESIPRNAYEIQAPRDGKIAEVYTWPGNEVGSGGIMARLEDSDVKAERQTLFERRNDFVKHLQRVEGLLEKDLITPDIWSNNVKKVNDLSAEIAILDEKIKTSFISAPQRGKVLWSDIKPGQTVTGAQPIFWVGDDKFLWMTAKIDEKYTAGIEKDDIAVVLTADEDPEFEPTQGIVDFVGFTGPEGENVNLYINVPRTSYAQTYKNYTVLINIPDQKDNLIIPENAIFDEQYAWILTPVEVETDKFFVKKIAVFPKRIENGVAILDSGKNHLIYEGVYLLLDPPEGLNNNQIISAQFEESAGWVKAYADQTLASATSRLSGGCGAAGGGCASGSCGAGSSENEKGTSEPGVCLVPSELFAEKPEDNEPAVFVPDLENIPGTENEGAILPKSTPEEKL